MDKKINFISIISVLMGFIVIIGMFTDWFRMLFSDITPLLIIGVVGSIISIWLIKKSGSQLNKIIAIIGLLLNALPVGYFTILYFGLG
ncbi:MAG: hypothetical protein IC227_07725 [Enterococcus lacertideformus]|uniref:Uncharacterized protein n=1 Tax=Enterococcus lacertideformus TaxID=2771493 RepID=A0A931FCX5_9ENTE|nr:hypothetical protein [Enterococcus lacertideformus]